MSKGRIHTKFLLECIRENEIYTKTINFNYEKMKVIKNDRGRKSKKDFLRYSKHIEKKVTVQVGHNAKTYFFKLYRGNNKLKISEGSQASK